jgi:hypothetical protein
MPRPWTISPRAAGDRGGSSYPTAAAAVATSSTRRRRSRARTSPSGPWTGPSRSLLAWLTNLDAERAEDDVAVMAVRPRGRR